MSHSPDSLRSKSGGPYFLRISPAQLGPAAPDWGSNTGQVGTLVHSMPHYLTQAMSGGPDFLLILPAQLGPAAMRFDMTYCYVS